MKHCPILSGSFIIFLAMTMATAFAPDSFPKSVTLMFPDGSYYEGQLKNHVKHGAGRHVGADGSEYRGGYADGKPHGEGTYSYPDGRRKKVLYDRGRLIESRFLSHDMDENGCIYGEFEFLGRYNGWFKGSKIKGFIPHGRGIMRYDNGSIFSGQWENGKMHGNGMVRWEDGSIYSGQWVHGKRSGFGTYIWPNGDSYVGEWKDNQLCGTGTYHYKNGKTVKGTWKEKKVFLN